MFFWNKCITIKKVLWLRVLICAAPAPKLRRPKQPPPLPVKGGTNQHQICKYQRSGAKGKVYTRWKSMVFYPINSQQSSESIWNHSDICRRAPNPGKKGQNQRMFFWVFIKKMGLTLFSGKKGSNLGTGWGRFGKRLLVAKNKFPVWPRHRTIVQI